MWPWLPSLLQEWRNVAESSGMIPAFSPHNRCNDFLPVVITDWELLAVSCHVCLTIQVCDLSTKSVSVAFHNGKYCLSQICHSSQGFIYTIHVPILKSKVKLMLLNCVTLSAWNQVLWRPSIYSQPILPDCYDCYFTSCWCTSCLLWYWRTEVRIPWESPWNVYSI